MNRQEAIRVKAPRYFTGKPCKHGHIVERYVNGGACVECHAQHAAASGRKKYAQDPAKECRRSKEWRKSNPDIVSFQKAKRISDLLNRTPKWLNAGHLFEIECIYRYRTALNAVGLDYHVDHIVPLRGKLVSGLHTPDNLQILPAKDNIQKSNSFVIE
jgi:hypothetical protein